MNRSEWKFLILATLIFISACIETDIYLPAFPDMMAYFSVSEESIQSLLTWNFFGICISGPLYGPLSDAYGRKKPMTIALVLFFVGSLITLFSEDFSWMLWGRLLQGIGSGGCFTLGTAVIFDAFQGEKAIRAANHLNSILPLLMALAPMLGGYLNYTFGFRSNFLAITLFVAMSLFVCVFFFTETLAKEKRSVFQFRKVCSDYRRACSTVAFWQVTIIISVLFAGYLAFLSITAVLFVVEFGVSKALFPFFQASLLGSYIMASLTCSRAVKFWGVSHVRLIGVVLVVLGTLCFLGAVLYDPRDPYLLTLAMVIYSFGTNWLQGLYFPEGMELLPDIKGVTASLITSTRLLLTAMIVGVAGHFYNATIFPVLIAIILVTLTTVCLMIFYERKRPARSPSIGPSPIELL